MSPASVLTAVLAPLESSRSNRRRHVRYPLQLELQYKVVNRDTSIHVGAGKTINISSGGILFESEGTLPPEVKIHLAIDWPFLLDGVCHLKLIAIGRIVRSDLKGTAVASVHYEFHTSKVRPMKA